MLGALCATRAGLRRLEAHLPWLGATHGVLAQRAQLALVAGWARVATRPAAEKARAVAGRSQRSAHKAGIVAARQAHRHSVAWRVGALHLHHPARLTLATALQLLARVAAPARRAAPPIQLVAVRALEVTVEVGARGHGCAGRVGAVKLVAIGTFLRINCPESTSASISIDPMTSQSC